MFGEEGFFDDAEAPMFCVHYDTCLAMYSDDPDLESPMHKCASVMKFKPIYCSIPKPERKRS